MTTIKTTSYTRFTSIHLASSGIISSYSTNSFDTYEEAVKDWEVNCRNRNKGDEYDAYWNARPCEILCETTTRTIIV